MKQQRTLHCTSLVLYQGMTLVVPIRCIKGTALAAAKRPQG